MQAVHPVAKSIQGFQWDTREGPLFDERERSFNFLVVLVATHFFLIELTLKVHNTISG